jgi:murein DD-endopeptidase MepM/ murein hydrolase activator NlpD
MATPAAAPALAQVGKAISQTASRLGRSVLGAASKGATREVFGLAASNTKILLGFILLNMLLTVGLISAPILAVVFGLSTALHAGVPLTTTDRTAEAALLGPGLFLCPVQNPVVTQPFGPTAFAGEPIINGAPFHTGIDLAVPLGRPLVAASSGTVTFAGGQTNAFGLLTGYGLHVMITDTQGRVELYGHMSQIQASVGQVVQAGQQIGLVGSTGFSTGPHVHFEVRVNGHPVNPAPNLRC